MGVTNLWKILSPSACKVSMEEIRGLRIGVDTSIWMVQFLSQTNERTTPKTLVLRGFFHRIMKLLNFRIKPIFIFDGKAPRMKQRTIEFRRKLQKNHTLRIKGLARKAAKRSHPKKKTSKKSHPNKPSIIRVEDSNIVPPPPSNDETPHFYSFALPGQVTGEVDFSAPFEDDEEEEDSEEESFEETVDKVYSNIMRDGEATFDNFFGYDDEVKREVFYMLKAAIVEQNTGRDVNIDVQMNPEEFSKQQRKEFVDEERNRERIVLKSIMTYEKKSKKKGVVSEGTLDGNPNLFFRIEKDVVSESSSSARNSDCGEDKTTNINEDEDIEFLTTTTIDKKSEERQNNNDEYDEEFMEFMENEGKGNEDTTNLLGELDSLLKEEEERIGKEEIEEIVISDDDEEEEEQETSNNNNIIIPPPPPPQKNKNTQPHIFPFEKMDFGDLEDEEIEGEDDEDILDDNIDFAVKNELQTGIKTLLSILGVPFIQSPYESDSQCGFLYTNKLIDAVVSQDSDMFLFGVGKVFRNFFSSKKMMEMYSMDLIEEQLGLDKKKLVQLAYLLGSDYTDGIKHVGIVHSMEILEAFCNNDNNNNNNNRNILEGLKEFQRWVKNDNIKKPKKKKNGLETRKEEFERKYFKSRKRFVSLDEERHGISFPNELVAKEYLKPTVNSSKQQFRWTPLENIEKLKLYQFSSRYMKMSKDEIDRFLEPVLKSRSYLRGRQKEIGAFFPRKAKKVAIIQSKRLKKAVGRMTKGKSSVGKKITGKKRKKRPKKGKSDDVNNKKEKKRKKT